MNNWMDNIDLRGLNYDSPTFLDDLWKRFLSTERSGSITFGMSNLNRDEWRRTENAFKLGALCLLQAQRKIGNKK